MYRTSAPGNRMRKTYGEKPAEHCDYCCNCQQISRTGRERACIAYDCNALWDPHQHACGLFNVAFAGIRPRIRPLAEMYQGRTLSEKNTWEQDSFLPIEAADGKEMTLL